MQVRCNKCGLRYRGVKSQSGLTPAKVERHEAGIHHQRACLSKTLRTN